MFITSPLDPYRPGGPIAVRIQKIQAVCEQLGIKMCHWTREEYVAICELAGVEPMPE